MNNPKRNPEFPIKFPLSLTEFKKLETKSGQLIFLEDPHDASAMIDILGYEGLIRTFCDILYDQHQDDEGCSYLFVERYRVYGFLRFGWGSCAGCDEFQACQSTKDFFTLAEKLYQQTNWIGQTVAEVKAYFDQKDWEDAYFGDKDWQNKSREFIAGALDSTV